MTSVTPPPNFRFAALGKGISALLLALGLLVFSPASAAPQAVDSQPGSTKAAQADTVGRTELVRNGSFARGTSGWRSNAVFTVAARAGSRERVAVLRSRGCPSCAATHARLRTRGATLKRVTPGAGYRASVLVRTPRTGQPATLQVRESGRRYTKVHRSRSVPSAGGWQRLAVEFTPQRGRASLVVSVRGKLAGQDRLLVDRVSLRETQSGEFPSAATTGVPDGVSLTSRGALRVTQDGAVIDGLDIRGQLLIYADNVTVRNTRVRSDDYFPVRIEGNNATIVDVEVDGLGAAGGSGGIRGGRNATILRADIQGVENGVMPFSGAVIRDSYIHDLEATGAPHYDGVQMDGDLNNIIITHNTIDMAEHDQTGAIMVDNWFGPISNILVAGNKLVGGGYTLYADGVFSSTDHVTAITYRDNVIGKGRWGYGLVRQADCSWTGNTDLNTGAPAQPTKG